jgi:hypothetical protein
MPYATVVKKSAVIFYSTEVFFVRCASICICILQRRSTLGSKLHATVSLSQHSKREQHGGHCILVASERHYSNARRHCLGTVGIPFRTVDYRTGALRMGQGHLTVCRAIMFNSGTALCLQPPTASLNGRQESDTEISVATQVTPAHLHPLHRSFGSSVLL